MRMRIDIREEIRKIDRDRMLGECICMQRSRGCGGGGGVVEAVG